MAAYKKIIGAAIRTKGCKPSGKMFDGGVIGHINSSQKIKSIHSITPNVGKEGFFMGKQASGPKTIHKGAGRELA